MSSRKVIGAVTPYGLALKNGFKGTEQEWLASLKGATGAQGERGPQGPQGPQGEQGPAGPAGSSADLTDINEQLSNHSKEIVELNSKIDNLPTSGGVSQEVVEQTVKSEIAKIDFETVKSPIYDASGFSKSSIEIAQDMLIGYNIGDYMDACNCRTWAYTIPDNVLDRAKYIETLWGNTRVDRAFIEYLASIGIQAIRLPITWMEFIDENDNLISKDWLNRAKELVTWIIESGMYCIINLHHDGLINWEHTRRIILEDAYMEQTTSYACNLWKQIAEHFKEFGYKLLFETFNEVCDTSKSMSANTKRHALATRLNKSIIDTIRKVGGNNSQRFIGCATYSGVSFMPSANMEELREYDSATDKLLSCSHSYPSGKLGVPTLSNYGSYYGEFGWKNPSENRVSYISDVHTQVQQKKFPCFWWDNGARDFNLINRFYKEPSYKAELEALVGKSLIKETFTYPNMVDGSQPYYAKFYTSDFDNTYGAKYVVICSAKPITKVEVSTMSKGVGYYKFVGLENALGTIYLSDDDVTYTRYITRVLTKFSQIRDDFHILGSTANTIWVDGNYEIADVPKLTETIECTGISLDNTSITFTTKDSQTLTATVEPTDTTESIEWSSSDTAIATVVNGVVTPKSSGTATITATCGSQTATCSIDTTSVNFSDGTSGGTDTPSDDTPTDDNSKTYNLNLSGKDTVAGQIILISNDDFIKKYTKLHVNGNVLIHAKLNNKNALTKNDIDNGNVGAIVVGIYSNKYISLAKGYSVVINDDGSADVTYTLDTDFEYGNTKDLVLYTKVKYCTYTITGTLTFSVTE